MDNNKQHNPPKVDKEKLAVAKQMKKKALVTRQVINKTTDKLEWQQIGISEDANDKNKLK